MRHLGDITKINGAEARAIYLCGRRYYVSDTGNVWNRYGRLLSQYCEKNGYKYVEIKRPDDETRSKCRVHRLVALLYIPNPNNLPQVNHIDGNKANNRRNNLEWVTGSENLLHSRYVLGHRTGFKDTPVLCVETGKVYRSTRDAWRDTGVNYAHISECANGKRKSAGGYHWRKETT